MSSGSIESSDAWLAERELLGMHFGLERMRRLMDELDDPQRRFRTIHVVGTNGKSSTVRMIAAILERHGLRTGTYLSPHLESFVERIEVGRRVVSDQRFAAAIARIARAAEAVDHDDDRITQFEALTAAAYFEFADRAVDVAVIEAGLGGRFDATSVIESDVQVLTNVGLEHTALLGSTHAQIAAEKLAVVPPEGNLVLGAGLHGDALRATHETITRTGASLTIARATPSVDPAVPGAFQRRNFALAEAAAAAFAGRLDPIRVAQAAASVRIPGRFEVVGHSPLTVIDGAHNPDGIRALIDALEHLPLPAAPLHRRRLVVALSILQDKDADGIVSLLLPLCRTFVATSSSSLRAQPAHELANLMRRLGGHVTAVEPDPARALAKARLHAGVDGVALATGSIALIGDLVVARARGAVRAA